MRRFDPFYSLVSAILRPFEGNLSTAEYAFVVDNAKKHANVMWLNLAGLILVAIGLQNASKETLGQVISSLIAPVMVMGTAWFAISFGGIPRHLMNIAMSVTFWMFVAFTVSLTTMLIAILFSVSLVMWPVFILVYWAALISCILYDTADGLKVGLDEAMLRHSRAALMYYEREGIPIDDEK